MFVSSRAALAAVTSTICRSVVVAVALGTLTVAAGGRASAQEACGDTTCPRGFTCQVVPGACPLIACRDGESCPPCTPQNSYVCSPAPCGTDADCATDMVCAAFESTACTTTTVTPPCPANTDCPAPGTKVPADGSSTCTTTTVHQCAPRWQLPCHAAADCGPGFDCQEQQSCGCSGGSTVGGGTPTPSSTPTSPPATGDTTPPDCTCTGTGTSACVAIVTVCTTDADCLRGWTCQVVPTGQACAVSSDGHVSCEPPPPPAMNCAPPYSGIPIATGRGTAVGSAPTANHDGAKPLDATSSGVGCSAAGGGRRISDLGWMLGLALIAAAWRRAGRRRAERLA